MFMLLKRGKAKPLARLAPSKQTVGAHEKKEKTKEFLSLFASRSPLRCWPPWLVEVGVCVGAGVAPRSFGTQEAPLFRLSQRTFGLNLRARARRSATFLNTSRLGAAAAAASAVAARLFMVRDTTIIVCLPPQSFAAARDSSIACCAAPPPGGAAGPA